jgi:2-dehydro-3-deoxygalactonokinase
MRQFLSCDWGTSSFRLKLVDTPTLLTLSEVHNNYGIASTNSSWQKSTKEESRFLFYASVIASAIFDLESRMNESFAGLPVILSGMASSSLGMVQLPYKQLPFKTDGSDLKVEKVKPSKEFNHDVFIISGVCSETDVMRGEETQLVGAVESTSGDTLYVFPGTHSKHISVKYGTAYAFRTYMTGELFSLLSKDSTLTEAVTNSDTPHDTNIEAFVAGVKDSANSNLLHDLFRVRTRFLLDKLGPEQNRSYLSGLLIGHEVNDILNSDTEGIIVISSNIGDHYRIAMQTLNFSIPFSVKSDNDASIRGQLRIVSHTV